MKKDKQSNSSLNDASDRINKRGETIDEKIKRLENELARCREQIKRIRPGSAQEAVKARALRVLKQKRTYEGQREMLSSQTFNLDQVSSAAEDAKQTHSKLRNSGRVRGGLFGSLIGIFCLPDQSSVIEKKR